MAVKRPAAEKKPVIRSKSRDSAVKAKNPAIRSKSPAATGTANVDKKADILIAIGATGSGKSTRIKADMDRRGITRLMVWDEGDEYTDLPAFHTIEALAPAVQQPSFAVRFIPSFHNKVKREQFNLFCMLAYAAKKCAMLCEELSAVVNANGGGPGWTAVMTRGRHRELIIYATSQRPALIDKTALSQATRLYCGNLEFPDDLVVMAKMLGVQVGDIQALKPWDYIEKHRETKQIHRGNLAQGAPG